MFFFHYSNGSLVVDFTAQFRQPTMAQEVTDVMKAAVSDGLVPVVNVDINSIMNNGKC